MPDHREPLGTNPLPEYVRRRGRATPSPPRMSAAQRQRQQYREQELAHAAGEAEDEDQQPRSSRRRRLNNGQSADVLVEDSQPIRATNGLANGNGNAHARGKRRAVQSDEDEGGGGAGNNNNDTSGAGGSNNRGAGQRQSEAVAEVDEADLEDDEADETDWEGLNLETYVEIGVTSTQAVLAKIDSLTRALTHLQTTHETGLDHVKETAMALEECRGDPGDGADDEQGEERGKEELANQLDARAKSLIDGLVRAQIMEAEMKALKTRLEAGEELLDMWTIIKLSVEDKFDLYMAKSERGRYKNSELYKDFRTSVWNVNSEVGCPPISDFLKKGDGEESDDDEIEVGGQTQQLKCPITMLPLEDAHSSTKCVHKYSGAAIKEYIQTSRPPPGRGQLARSVPAVCPVSGCAAMITEDDLKRDVAAQKQADLAKRRADRREEEENDDAELVE